MNSALIIGSEGQDGQLLIKFLKEKGYFLAGASRSDYTRSVELVEFLSVDLARSDLGKLEDYIKRQQPNEIYYLAAHHISSQETENFSSDEIEKSVAVNYLSFLKLLEICHIYSPKSRILYTSSSLIFSGVFDKIQSEDTITEPRCLYSLNKVAAMQTATFYREKYKLFTSVAIMYNHESKYRNDYFLSKRIVNQVRAFVKGDITEITIGNLDSITDWGYALDYMEAIWQILQQKQPDTYIVSSGNGHTVKDWFVVLEDYLQKDLLPHVQEDKMLISRSKPTLIGNNSKLLRIGWKPVNSFQEMVIKIYNNEL
jgi:GDPmannose 4,6-dehydratase